MSTLEAAVEGRVASAFPSAEELRMVRAIARSALLEAARHGEYRATFHGFRVRAVRGPGAASRAEVSLWVSLGPRIVVCSRVVASEAGGREPTRCAAVP